MLQFCSAAEGMTDVTVLQCGRGGWHLLAIFIDETGVTFFDESLVAHAVPTGTS